jgi:hypothetical protein
MYHEPRFIKVIDNFLPNFELVRPLLDGVEFSDHVYKGKNYTGFGKITLPIKKLIEEEMGFMVEFKQSHVRVGTKNTPLTHYIHSDSADAQYACVLYFNEPSCDTGTMFWRHKATGLDRMKQPVDPCLFEMLSKHIGDESHWDKLEYVKAKANTAVIFDASLFHSRFPKDLPIEDGETPRLVSTIFFNKIEVPSEFRFQQWDEIEDRDDFEDAKEGNYFGLVNKSNGDLVRVYIDHNTSKASVLFSDEITACDKQHVAAIVDSFTYRPFEIEWRTSDD